MSEEKKIGYRDIFRQKEYMKLLTAGLINGFGDSIDAIAFTWLVYQLTGNAAWSALVFGINSLPTILVTPFAGVWVEGRNKKHIMIGTDIMRACCVLFVALSCATERLQPWMLVATTILISTVEAFRGPADTALTPKVLDREYLEYGLSLDGSLSRAVSIIGTALAGGIIALFGITGAIYIDIATFLVSAGIIAFMRYQEEKVSPGAFSGKEYMRSLKDGVQYVRKSSTFMFFIAACVVLNALLTPFNSLQAPLVEEVLQSGATMLSVISVAATGGIMFGSISYPWVKNYLSARKLFGLCGFGICFYYILLVAGRPLYVYELPAYVYAAVWTAFMGCFASWLMTFMNVEFIKKVNEEYLARASGILTAANVASMPVMSFLISAIIGFTGTVVILVGTGIIGGIICVFMARSRELDEMEGAGNPSGNEIRQTT